MGSSLIYRISGILGMAGCLGVIASDIIGIAVHEAHDPISDTISMLAIGKYGWIQDLGLDFLGIGFIAVAIGLFNYQKKGWKWKTSLAILVLIAVDILLIAEHNQYANESEETIHRRLVYLLAFLFPLLCFLSSFGLKSIKPSLKRFSFWIAGLWIILAPLFPFVPDSLDGAYERLTCSLIALWLLVTSYQIFSLPEKQ